MQEAVSSGSGRTESTIAWIAGTRFDDLPRPVIARVQDLLLDTLAVAIGAARVPATRIVHDLATSQFAAGDPLHAVRLPFDGRAVSPAGAALALATRIDNLDAHDGYQPAKGHAGVSLVAALLACGQRQPAPDGRAAITALAIGYEVACRAGAALHATAGDYHSSGAWNALGAATLGCRLAGMRDEAMIERCLGIAEYHAPRAPMMREIDHPSMLHDSSGWGALAGVVAASLAGDGFDASPPALLHDPRTREFWRDLGSRWLVNEQYVKPYPVCFWAQPAVHAALVLCRTHELAASMIAGVHIDTFHEAGRLAAGVPATTAAAQYSLAFPVACGLVRGQVGPDEIAGSGLEDPVIAELTGRITVDERTDFNAAFPARRLAEVTLQLADGRTLSSGPFEPLGVPDNPLDRAAIEDKLRLYAEGLWSRERQDALIKAVQSLHRADADLSPLLDLCLLAEGEC